MRLLFTSDHRRSETFIFDTLPVSFTPGPIGGVSQVSVLRLGGEWTFRDRRQVFALRSTFNVGLDILGATKNPESDISDGEFFYWLGQAQWARRFDLLKRTSQLILRMDVQVSNAPLLALEQFAMGGHSTVRGYRENTLVRDNGVIGSVELRVPVWTRPRGPPILELAPFFDAGHSWNTSRETVGPRTLASVGIGARMQIFDWARFQIYWGHRIEDVNTLESSSLQREGVHLGLTVDLP